MTNLDLIPLIDQIWWPRTPTEKKTNKKNQKKTKNKWVKYHFFLLFNSLRILSAVCDASGCHVKIEELRKKKNKKLLLYFFVCKMLFPNVSQNGKGQIP